jgi:hypothetical protein
MRQIWRTQISPNFSKIGLNLIFFFTETENSLQKLGCEVINIRVYPQFNEIHESHGAGSLPIEIPG